MDIAQTVFFCTMINLRSSILRIVCASFVGAIIGCIVLICSNHLVIKVLTANVFIPCVMIYILYRGKIFLGIKTIFKYILIWYFCAFALSGHTNYLLKETLTIRKLITTALFVCTVGVIVVRRHNLASVRSINDSLYNITIYKGERILSGYAKYDSGNMLIEPISGFDVIVCDKKNVNAFLTEGEKEYIKMFPALPDKWDGITYTRSIPYSSVGKKHGMLPAVLLDEVCITKDNKYKKYGKCYLAVSDEIIASDAAYGFLLNYKMKI